MLLRYTPRSEVGRSSLPGRSKRCHRPAGICVEALGLRVQDWGIKGLGFTVGYYTHNYMGEFKGKESGQ